MKKEMTSLGLIILCITVVFSGCTTENNSTNTNNQGTIGQSESFSAGTSAGQYSILDDTVEVNVYSGSVSEPVNITVESITNPVQDSSLVMLSCYEFRPDGLTFARPIDVILHYNLNDIPSGVAESSLKVYVLNGSSWEPIKGSFANEMMHYAVAKVSHFSKMACGGAAPSHSNPNGGGSGSENDTENTSAQYWFKADLYFYSYKDLRLTDGDHDDDYMVGVSAYWAPVSYVQYYQIKYDFHGNPPKDYSWGCDFRDQGKYYCLPRPSSLKQGFIYHLGGDPNLDGFLGLIDTNGTSSAHIVVNQETGEMKHYYYGESRPNGTHGYAFFGVYTTVEDAEGLSDIAIGSLVSEMEAYVHEYVDGWEVWVRAVTERGG
jgi:hypothetical protein